MKCLWCEDEISMDITWVNVFFPEPPKKLCPSCEPDLEPLKDSLCHRCSRKSDTSVCPDCERWEHHPMWKGVLSFNRSVFSYNSTLQGMIAKWKYRGDYVLREAFQEVSRTTFKQTFQQIAKEAILVPIPLSEERLYERGFNQAEAIADLLGHPFQQKLERIDGGKQSKKSRKDRITSENPFRVEGSINKPVILIDDIYTTGITVRHAAIRLKEVGCPTVYSFTLAR
ncbi:ComF family protein [Aquibacillus albus]|uniref:Competence protein ComFC n=1 Tax=Aquibacillus albus TaxID=1168171 RepID=A0ABS2MWM0_9BACI|nr:ComF family protein [Aquibacillus albus]MBM7570250.1 competence protein ComFC [Aquibacillus albus]